MDRGKDRRIRWGLRAMGLGGLLAGLIVVNSGPALANCHQFTVTAIPSSVAEGGKVLVTVSRDGNSFASSIHLSTVDETAKAGTDYVAINQTVAFTMGGAVQKQFTLSTIDDHVTESSETFRLHLSNPSGCLGTGYIVGPDVRVTIQDNDVSPTPTATKPTATAKPTLVPSPTPTPSVTPSPQVSQTETSAASPASPAPSPSPSESDVAAGAPSNPESGSALQWVGAAFLVLAAIGTFVLRRRRN